MNIIYIIIYINEFFENRMPLEINLVLLTIQVLNLSVTFNFLLNLFHQNITIIIILIIQKLQLYIHLIKYIILYFLN